jgi:hypothetical protein
MKINIWLFGALVILAIMFGFFAGVSVGAISIVEKTAYALSGSTFIVNLNETKLINEMNKTIVPTMLKELNKTAQEMTK